MLVVLKGQLSRGIYTHMGTTFIGEVDAATTLMIEEDITKLWHMQLGHMSQKGLALLCSQNNCYEPREACYVVKTLAR